MTGFAQKHYIFHIGLALYIVILFFGSLHPITSWQWPDFSSWYASFEKETRYTPQNDLVINFLIYIPLGIMTSLIAKNKLRTWRLFLVVCSILAALSLTIEFLQLFIPTRAQSFIDFAMNTAGAGTGALIYLLVSLQNELGLALSKLRYSLFYRGRYIDFGLLTVLTWSLSELNPFLPSLNLSDIFLEIDQFNLLNTITIIDLPSLIEFCLESFAIIIILSICLRLNHHVLLISISLLLLTIFLKFPIQGVTALPEELIGLFIAAFFYFTLHKRIQATKILLAIYALVFSFIISQLNHSALSDPLHIKELNWIPFYFQFNRINHIQEILETIWAVSALCFLIINLKIQSFQPVVIIGVVTLASVTLAIEWQQQYLIHTSPDITNVLIAIGTWLLPFMHPEIRNGNYLKPLN